tara:strand:- start:110 stop:931 length:822 start_codon:yes stop_codon:yes gene_type:complete
MKKFIDNKIILLYIRISLRIFEIISKYLSKEKTYNKKLSKKIFGEIARINILSKNLKIIGASIDPYRSTNNIESIIAEYAPELLSQNTFFIEAGANDGINASNTYFLESLYGARGILIEPSASLFEQCRFNRDKSNIFEHCAIGNPKKDNENLEFIYSGLMTVSTKVDVLNPDMHAIAGQEFCSIEPYKFLAPLKSLTKILKINKIKRVDFMSLDLEGGEIEALKGADLINYTYKYILVETRNKEEMESFMLKNGYKLIIDLAPLDQLFKKII